MLDEAPIFDSLEDQMIDGLNPKELRQPVNIEGATDEHAQKNRRRIYERTLLKAEAGSPSDDLGIIDLDNDDDEDVFDVDDDKLPVLKNIISKKNRPNNGKSVAIGSRSQGGIMRFRGQGDAKEQEAL